MSAPDDDGVRQIDDDEALLAAAAADDVAGVALIGVEAAGAAPLVERLRAVLPSDAVVLCSGDDHAALWAGADAVIDDATSRADLAHALAQARTARVRRMQGGAAASERHALVAWEGDGVPATFDQPLSQRGFSVHHAADADAALETLRAIPAHVAFFDDLLPGGGVAALAAARRFDRELRLALVTSGSSVDDVSVALRHGADDLIVKPPQGAHIASVAEGAWTAWAVGMDRQALLAGTALSRRGPPLRVLLVEDDPLDTELFVARLELTRGVEFDVTPADSVRAAQRALEADRFDIIVTDLRVLDSQGLATALRLRGAAPSTPIMVVTGDEDLRLGEAAMACGMEAYIRKGEVGTEALVMRMRYAIESRRLINRLEKTARNLHASLTSQRNAIEHTSDSVFLVDDAEGLVRFANGAALELLDRPPEEVIGQAFQWSLEDRRDRTVSWAVDDEERSFELRCDATDWRGRPAQVVTLRDITRRLRDTEALRALNAELAAAKATVEEMARFDPLTGTLNRRGFELALFEHVSRVQRSDAPLAALLIDCDDFKGINDRYGHNVGDAVLRQVANSVAGAIRPVDVLARIGGDEFLVLCVDTPLAAASIVADRVRVAVSEHPLAAADGGVRQTISIGVAAVERETASIEEILAATHLSLKRSKLGGKNRVTAPSLPVTVDRPGGSPTEALPPIHDASVYRAVAQAIVDPDSGRPLGYEMLARTILERAAMPGQFLALAREHNLAVAVDLHCLRACVAAAEALEGARTLHYNLLPSTLMDVPVERLLPLLGHPRQGDRVCLELCEQQFIGDPAYLRDAVADLQARGVHVALDDVGFGRSSLEALIVLEPAVVKIDRRYIHGVANDPGLRRRLARLLSVVRAIGADIVAEGVETEAERAVVIEMGIPAAQGYLWGRPAPLAESAASPAAPQATDSAAP